MNKQNPDEEDVLLAFAVEPVHDLATIERYLSQYPQFGAALLACRLELAIAHSDMFPVAQPSKSADQAWMRFSQLTGMSTTPFAALNSAALRSLASTINVSVPFLIRLRDRAIAAATIPPRFIQMVAEQLRVQPLDLLSYLRLTPDYGDTNFKSEVKPTPAPQIDFVEAVRSSQLTDAQQKALLALKD